MRKLAAVVLAGSLATASAAFAQGVPAAKPAATPSKSDYAAALMALDCETCEGKVDALRGFSLATPGAKATGPAASGKAAAKPAAMAVRMASTGQPPPAAAKRLAADLQLTFALGSAELTPAGAANARNFAAALNDPRLAGTTFTIVGHTDATGSVQRNQQLSEDRAQSVKAYLVGQGVDAARLQTRGVGSRELAVPSDPTAAPNRRVEVQRAG